jgi:3-hydroxyacyl-CoA dehydrogenase/enoyl-CoA hydratase/3-hydroxybutyryl-CoA epimerase
MPLVEVVHTERSDEVAVATAVEVSRRMDKTTIVVGDGPGFFTTRVLAPFLNEAAWCLTEGASIDEIDRALTGWGWPVGAMALLDEVGLDVAQHAAETLVESLGERLSPPEAFARLIEDGRKGRKSGRGFYRYDGNGKRVDEEVYRLLDWQPRVLDGEEIAERCWLQMLNEAARCMEEGIVERPNDVDLGVIFGFGFPPFRGGLLRHADAVGIGECLAKLERFAERHGPRFEPAPLLARLAREGRRFRSDRHS